MRVIVFVLRGCPVGCLGAYGNEWIATPNLDRFAAEGVVFDHHISDCPDPEAANRSWLTGQHQMPPVGGDGGVLPSESRLTEALRAAGIRTVLVQANHPDTDAAPPFYAAWDEVFDARPEADDNSPLDALVRAFPSVLDKLGTEPHWLIWVETDRLLPPWDVPQDVFEAYVTDEEEDEKFDRQDEEEDEEADESIPEAVELDEPVTPFADPPTGPFDRADRVAWEWLHSTFAAVVTKLDAELGWLFDELRPRGLDQTAAWLIASDFGYPLGEHGQVGVYRPWLHEELIHLPLLLRLPGAAEAGRRVSALTQPADLAPTLLDLFGVDAVPAAFHGYSLLPLIRGEADSVRDCARSGLAMEEASEWAIRTGEWAYLLPGPVPPTDSPRAPQLYEKPDDRWEVNDLHARQSEHADELEQKLRYGEPPKT